MATIKINFDKKSIQNAIKQVNAVKKKLSTKVVKVFLEKCVEWVKNRANENLDMLDIGGNIIAEIKNSWGKPDHIGENAIRLTNTTNKSVFVEFGVGLVGSFENFSHPNANNTTPPYEYNKKSDYKDANGMWTFKVDDREDVDLDVKYYDIDKNGWVTTQGSPANLFLYNALMDLKSEMAYKTLWQESLKQTI